MKVLTVRQPWASLIVAGIKDVENRPWRTRYRGKLGIHAGARVDEEAMNRYSHLVEDSIPLGALIGSVVLVGCVQNSRSQWAVKGQWHWLLDQPRQLRQPRWMSGRLGLWTLGG